VAGNYDSTVATDYSTVGAGTRMRGRKNSPTCPTNGARQRDAGYEASARALPFRIDIRPSVDMCGPRRCFTAIRR
jgi:hypothetical protein